MKLVVCGDSWFSSDTRYPGLSFPETLANKKNWELISLARGGCSNFAIVLQIKKAISLEPDIIIIGGTTPDRIEIPIRKEKNKTVWEKLRTAWSWNSWIYSQPKVYNPRRGLSNISYDDNHVDLSSRHEFLKDPTILSESLSTLLFDDDAKGLDQEQIDSLKSYVLNLYDSEIKKQYDSWIISNACKDVLDKKIPFLLSAPELLPSEFSWLPDQYKLDVNNESFIIRAHDPTCDHLFHYNAEHGMKVTNYIETRLKKIKIN